MLVVTRKQYEIDEPVKAVDEKNETLYEFKMQLTAEEVQEIKEILLDDKNVEEGKELSKLEHAGKIDEYNQLQEKINERLQKQQDRFEYLCFKEHKEPFIEKAGKYKYIEMVDTMFDFFMSAFIEKRIQQANTMSSHLRKITTK